MEIHPLIDPYSLHYDTFAGDVYTLDTAGITLTGGTLTANTLTDGTLSCTGGAITGCTSLTVDFMTFDGFDITRSSVDGFIRVLGGAFIAQPTQNIDDTEGQDAAIFAQQGGDASGEPGLLDGKNGGDLYLRSGAGGSGDGGADGSYGDVLIADDGGNITLGGAACLVSINGQLDVDTLNFSGNVISDSTGAISFGNESLVTTGRLAVGSSAVSSNVFTIRAKDTIVTPATAVGIKADLTYTPTSDTLNDGIGIEGAVTYLSPNFDMGELVGVKATPGYYDYSGTATDSTAMIGFLAEPLIYTTQGTLGSICGIKVGKGSTWTINSATNVYGMYLDTFNGGTNNWSLYSASAEDSYFAGKVGINIENPTEILDVGGNVNVTGVYKVDDTQVIKEQQSAIADIADTTGTDSDGTARLKVNDILAMLRTHGLIET